jgi:hypothetical protein
MRNVYARQSVSVPMADLATTTKSRILSLIIRYLRQSRTLTYFLVYNVYMRNVHSRQSVSVPMADRWIATKSRILSLISYAFM